MKKIIDEFKKFALKGNALDMAVGIILGANFSKIVDSLVNDILMPPLGLLLGRVDFANLFFVLKEGAKIKGPYDSLAAAKQAGAVSINYGACINVLISFAIVSVAVFLLVKSINTLRAKMEEKEPIIPNTKKCPYCCSDIPLKATKCPHCTSDIEN